MDTKRNEAFSLKGPLSRFLADDHRRVEALLDLATSIPGSIHRAPYEEFRAGLLRHIGMEEKLLLPAVQRTRGGTPLPAAKQLHLDHGAIAALLVPTPTLHVIARLRALLALHDALEEGPGGVYENCDELLSDAAAGLLDQLRKFPAVRTAPHNDGPLVERHITETLALAGRVIPLAL